jgi:hypothetical protein
VPDCGLGDARKRLALKNETESVKELSWPDGQQAQS